MKRLFKKMIPIMALLIVSTTVLTCLFGCTGKNSNRFDTDLFCCMYNKEKTGVIILSLTKKGKEQEILVIPEEINGLPVVQLGGTTPGYPYQMQHYVESDNLKKIYFNNSNYLSVEKFRTSQSVEIFAMNNNCFIQTVLFGNRFGSKFSCYTTEKIYNDNAENLLVRSPLSLGTFSAVTIANMNFWEVTDVDEEIIWIDNISENSIYYCPYLDREWYLNEECTILWDKNYSILDNQEKLNVFCKQNGGEHD